MRDVQDVGKRGPAGESRRPAGAEPPPDLIRSVSRAFRIIEAVGNSPTGLTAKQIARRCEINLATVYHLVRTLSYEGYLHRRDNGAFTVGLNFCDRYREMSAAFRAPDNLAEGLRRAARRTGHSHYLGQFIDGRVAITGVADGMRTPPMGDMIVGFDDGAHATALGKALLSTLAPEARHRYLREMGMWAYTPHTITDHERLDYELALQAQRGLFVEVEQYRQGVACAAVLVTPHAEPDQALAVACAMPVQDFTAARNDMCQQLRATARGLVAMTNGNAENAANSAQVRV